MRVTVVQMSPTHLVEDNIAAASSLIERACDADRSDLIILPEIWSCLGGDTHTKWQAAETLPDPAGRGPAGRLYAFLSELARRRKIIIHGGSIGERVADGLCNTTLVFGEDGVELARYRKIHLFDVVTPGGERYCESDIYHAGNQSVTFPAGDMTVGCAICYDLRFGRLFEALRDGGAELVILPAAFTVETGAAHWEILVRARAIETQSWIAAAATTGPFTDAEGRTRSTYGHSMICDPWGRVIAQAGRDAGWITAELDRAVTDRVRRAMPIWQHRRAFVGDDRPRT